MLPRKSLGSFTCSAIASTLVIFMRLSFRFYSRALHDLGEQQLVLGEALAEVGSGDRRVVARGGQLRGHFRVGHFLREGGGELRDHILRRGGGREQPDPAR